MLSCKEVTTLRAGDALERSPLMTRLAVRLHLLMCRHCRRYARELARIRAAARALYDDATSSERDEELVRRALENRAQ